MQLDHAQALLLLGGLEIYVVLRDIHLIGFLLIIRVGGEFGFELRETLFTILNPAALQLPQVIAACRGHGFRVHLI